MDKQYWRFEYKNKFNQFMSHTEEEYDEKKFKKNARKIMIENDIKKRIYFL